MKFINLALLAVLSLLVLTPSTLDATELNTKTLDTFTEHYSSCDNSYKYKTVAGGSLEYGCDTSWVDESFSYYWRDSGDDSYRAYVKSGSNSSYGLWKTDGVLSKAQQSFTAGTQTFGIDD